ncbi:MAG: hypothetical protein ABTQ27_07940 [Amaricoccus sp.]|uniref:hypothetical protein n=1 Tax=Amaricoccus sp. TaxID=1872485 RepID=UPI00331592EE
MKRAIVLVPQWGTAKRNETRELLAKELLENDRYLVGAKSEGAIEGETFCRLTPHPAAAPDQPMIDLYEAYWSDMAAADRPDGPVEQFLAAGKLVAYWLLHPWWILSLRSRRAMPIGLALSGILLLGWYFVAAVALAHFLLELPAAEASRTGAEIEMSRQAEPPAVPAEGEPATEGEEPAAPAGSNPPPTVGDGGTAAGLVVALAEWLRPPAEWLVEATSHAWFAVLLALLAFLPTLRMAALAGFTRHYLSTGATTGFAGDVQQRVQDTLRRVYDQPSSQDPARPEYDEVILLGHSLGAVVALEAIADYGDRSVRTRTTLVTWGSPIAILINRSRRLAEALDVATSGSVTRWIDVNSSADLFTAPIRAQAARYRDASINTWFSVGWWQSPTTAHEQYFFTNAAISILLAPKSDVGEVLSQPGPVAQPPVQTPVNIPARAE